MAPGTPTARSGGFREFGPLPKSNEAAFHMTESAFGTA